eukprot:16241300-Heterocapsa_arctica.AAC.1
MAQLQFIIVITIQGQLHSLVTLTRTGPYGSSVLYTRPRRRACPTKNTADPTCPSLPACAS